MWSASIALFNPVNIRNIVWRLKFFGVAASRWRFISNFVKAVGNEGLANELNARPDMMGVLLWPYINASWTLEQKLSAIERHYLEVNIGSVFSMQRGESREILDLNSIRSGLKIVLDRAIWFRREGELVLNIFLDADRIYSLSFSFGRIDGEKIAYIGGLQGVVIPNILELYKDLTKELYGIRPRDFIIQVFRLVCLAEGVKYILAVSDKCRHHHASYFGESKGKEVIADYDKFWSEQGGVYRSDGFFYLTPGINFRAIEDIASNKRSLYRKRYAFIDEISTSLATYVVRKTGVTPK
jgi:uncharacterized protein VirK/YbjX